MKKIRYVILLSVLVSASELLQAQKFSVGVRGALSIPNLTAGGSEVNPLNRGYSSRLGPDLAIFGEFQISPVFSIRPMIEYSSQGGKKDGFQAMTVPEEFVPMFPPGQIPPYLYADYKSEAKLNYLMIPVLGKFAWNLSGMSHIKIYADVGPFAGFLLSAKQVTSGSSIIYADEQKQQPLTPSSQSFDKSTDIKDQLNTFNLGVSGNLGFSYHFSRSSIFIEGGGNYGFLNIQKGDKNGKNNTGAGTIGIGYSYLLGR